MRDLAASPRVRRSLSRIAVVRLGYRAVVLWRERATAGQRPGDAVRYLARGREISNMTYELANRDDIVPFVAGLPGAVPQDVARHLRELQDDAELRRRLAARLRCRPDRERQPLYGKRALYYCIVRCERAPVVVETGTHDGLGSMVLGSALSRNAADGAPGELLTFDINPDEGWLIGSELADRVRVHVGDTRETLPRALSGRTVGVFLHDSAKTLVQESFEFETGLRHRGDRVVLITDEARATGVLRELSRREGGRYATFKERPLRHWWPGNEIGVAVIERAPGP
jgi:predicted O-methyltransferase YrrM